MSQPSSRLEPPASGDGPLRVLVIDDHPLFCDALSMTLEGAVPDVSISTANCLGDALERIGDGPQPEIVLLDLNLPDVDGLEGLIRLCGTIPRARVIVVSSLSDNRMIASAIGAGAAGFIPKDSARGTLIDAFARIRGGEVYVPEDFVAPDDAAPDDEAEVVERLKTLTPAQARILEFVCAGKLNKQIAHELSISETTVKAHITAVLRKLGVHNRTQAVLTTQRARFSLILKDVADDA